MHKALDSILSTTKKERKRFRPILETIYTLKIQNPKYINPVNFLFLFILAVIRLELRASHLLGRCSSSVKFSM
jgi:hypothetical protein